MGTSFPHIRTPQELIEPLAYLSNSVEYNEMKNATNKKIVVDNFWLGKTDDMDRARELIRIYYNRVFLANYYFTTFKPGWKTDRGMIYIIYGPPQATYRSITNEKWVIIKRIFHHQLHLLLIINHPHIL
ncbi:MAG: GWxTD domain-containing protein [Bacteroidales bacterium]|nr:GWxTD domain-containing protein [Bacteroidales bacterium]